MDDLLSTPHFEVEVNESLVLLWDDATRKIHDMGAIKTATERTLEGIYRKCPDFPAKPLLITPVYNRKNWKIAAVVIPLLIVGSLVVNRMRSEVTDYTEPETISYPLALSLSTATAAAGIHHIDAARGDQIVRLPDGSTIQLMQGAQLDYQEDYTEHRIVTLQGNAFFSITSQENLPFQVIYNDLTIRVLGTEFYLQQSEQVTEITLHSGSVEVISSTENIVLAPNQQLVMDRELGEFSVYDLSDTELEKMLRGGLRFDGTPLNEAIKKTGEFFGIHIDAAGMNISEPVRLQFGLKDELDDVLFVLQSVSGNRFDYEITGPNVIIRSR